MNKHLRGPVSEVTKTLSDLGSPVIITRGTTVWLRYDVSSSNLSKAFRRARKALSNWLGESRLVYDYALPSASWDQNSVSVDLSRLYRFGILEVRITVK